LAEHRTLAAAVQRVKTGDAAAELWTKIEAQLSCTKDERSIHRSETLLGIKSTYALRTDSREQYLAPGAGEGCQ